MDKDRITELIALCRGSRRKRGFRIGKRLFAFGLRIAGLCITLGLLLLGTMILTKVLLPIDLTPTLTETIGLLLAVLVPLCAGQMLFYLITRVRNVSAAGPAVWLADEKELRLVREALSGLDDLHACGILIEALQYADGGVRLEVIAALIRLLPRLQETEAEPLTPDQRRILLDALAHEQDIDLQIAILKAYRAIGDASALEPVRRLATEPITHLTDGRIRKAAVDCLPYIEERAAIERRRQTLLRPSAEPAEASDTLLRPAAGAGEADVQVLLRPAGPEER